MSTETIETAIQQIVDADYLCTDGIDVKVYIEDYVGEVEVITDHAELLTPTGILPSTEATPARQALEDCEALMQVLLEDGHVLNNVSSEYSRLYYKYQAVFVKEGKSRRLDITLSIAAINNATDLVGFVTESLTACGFTVSPYDDPEGTALQVSKPVETEDGFQQQIVGYILGYSAVEVGLEDEVLGNNPENRDEAEALFTSHAHKALSRSGAVLAKIMKLTTADATRHTRVYRYKDKAYVVHSL